MQIQKCKYNDAGAVCISVQNNQGFGSSSLSDETLSRSDENLGCGPSVGGFKPEPLPVEPLDTSGHKTTKP